MQNIKWLSFSVSNAITRSIVHFFPASESVTAPYAANCTLGLFGENFEKKNVVLEGGRLSHPDGVRLEDAFTFLRNENSGVFGLEVELSSNQPRLDLSGSGCVVEIQSQGVRACFRPTQTECNTPPSLINPRSEEEKCGGEESSPLHERKEIYGGFIFKDALLSSSFIVVNQAETSLSCLLTANSGTANHLVQGEPIQSSTLNPFAINEITFSDNLWESIPPQEYSWGLLRGMFVNLACSRQPPAPSLVKREANATTSNRLKVAAVSSEARKHDKTAVYAVYRDANTRRMVSILPLKDSF